MEAEKLKKLLEQHVKEINSSVMEHFNFSNKFGATNENETEESSSSRHYIIHPNDAPKWSKIISRVPNLNPILAIDGSQVVTVFYKAAAEATGDDDDVKKKCESIPKDTPTSKPVNQTEIEFFPKGEGIITSTPKSTLDLDITTTLSDTYDKIESEIHKTVEKKSKRKREKSCSMNGSFVEKRFNYTENEIRCIYNGVARFGLDFRMIFLCYRNKMHPTRTPVKLYDKWRHDLCKYEKNDYLSTKFR